MRHWAAHTTLCCLNSGIPKALLRRICKKRCPRHQKFHSAPTTTDAMAERGARDAAPVAAGLRRVSRISDVGAPAPRGPATEDGVVPTARANGSREPGRRFRGAHRGSFREPGRWRGGGPYDGVGAVHLAGVPPLQAVRRRDAARGVHDAGRPGLWFRVRARSCTVHPQRPSDRGPGQSPRSTVAGIPRRRAGLDAHVPVASKTRRQSSTRAGASCTCSPEGPWGRARGCRADSCSSTRRARPRRSRRWCGSWGRRTPLPDQHRAQT